MVKKMDKTTYINHVKNVFTTIDKDKSGYLDADEVWAYHQETARVMGVLPNEEEFQRSFRILDKDGDGTVTLKEMLALAEEDWTKLQMKLDDRQGRRKGRLSNQNKSRWKSTVVPSRTAGLNSSSGERE